MQKFWSKSKSNAKQKQIWHTEKAATDYKNSFCLPQRNFFKKLIYFWNIKTLLHIYKYCSPDTHFHVSHDL